MTKIRLARTGSTHNPHYRIVVADSRSRRDGRFIEILGTYHPHQDGMVTINQERAHHWVSVGAQPTNTVITLLTKAGVKHPFQVRKKPFRAKEEPAAEAATADQETVGEAEAEATETPTELAESEAIPAEEQPAES